jgi:hypothetical protein
MVLAGEEHIPLALFGNRKEPDPQAVALAQAVPSAFNSWRASIEGALFEHYAPYAEAVAAGEPPSLSESVAIISTSSQVWPHVAFAFVSVTPLAGELTIELGLTVTWDDEHTLGARFQAGRFLELNGSVLPP